MRLVPLATITTAALFAQQSALDPAGPGAGGIWTLGAIFLGLLGSIFLIVIVLALIPLLRRHRGIEQEPLERTHRPSAWTEKKLTAAVGIATAGTVVILIGLVFLSVIAGKATSHSLNRANSLVIEITAYQWWWSVRYMNDTASRIVVTANELHIPVGRPVMIRGTSNDVIHSFWVPNLQGKRDLIPSRITAEWIQAARPGRFRGQCGEFCGLQHAHMALWVVAEPASRFDLWYARQLEPGAAPSGSQEARGREIFLNSACVLCHAIQGTPASGRVGPDLTHFASRLSLAAGARANNKGNLAGWLADPQTMKPGTHMATVPIKAEDMQPLLDYLESLQ